MAQGKPNFGASPRSEAFKEVLRSCIQKREPKETIVIHHFTDKMDVLQLEVERRSETLGITFERHFIR